MNIEKHDGPNLSEQQQMADAIFDRKLISTIDQYTYYGDRADLLPPHLVESRRAEAERISQLAGEPVIQALLPDITHFTEAETKLAELEAPLDEAERAMLHKIHGRHQRAAMQEAGAAHGLKIGWDTFTKVYASFFASSLYRRLDLPEKMIEVSEAALEIHEGSPYNKSKGSLALLFARQPNQAHDVLGAIETGQEEPLETLADSRAKAQAYAKLVYGIYDAAIRDDAEFTALFEAKGINYEDWLDVLGDGIESSVEYQFLASVERIVSTIWGRTFVTLNWAIQKYELIDPYTQEPYDYFSSENAKLPLKLEFKQPGIVAVHESVANDRNDL